MQKSSSSGYSSSVFRVAGLSKHKDAVKRLAKLNPDWRSSPQEIISSGKAGQKIFQIKFTNGPVAFQKDPGAGTLNVLIANEHIGHIAPEDIIQAKKILKDCTIHSISCGIWGGRYKVIDEHGNEETGQQGVSVTVRIIYDDPLFGAPAAAPKAPTKQTSLKAPPVPAKQEKKRKKKKSIFRRWWFLLLLLLSLGFCGRSEEPTPEPLPTEDFTIETFPTFYEEFSFVVDSTATSVPVETWETFSYNSFELPSQTDVYTETTSPAVIAETTIPTEAPPLETSAPVSVETTSAPETISPTQTVRYEQTYILNTNTGKFHTPGCSSVKKMNEANKSTFVGTRDEVISRGYEACKRCYP